MKPFQILVFFLSIVLVLLVIALVFPSEGIKISDEYSLKFFTLKEVFHDDDIQYADISDIIENDERLAELKNEIFREDSIYEEPVVGFDTIRADPDSLKRITHLIEFPANNKDVLDPVFKRLTNLEKSRELIRILHYGDSQIESDRITSILRHRLQMKFGGRGGGMIPPVPLYHGKMTIKQEYSENWVRFTGFHNIDSTIRHKRYGPLFAFSTYVPDGGSSAGKAWLKYEPSSVAYPTSRNFNKVAMYFGGNCKDLLVKTYISNTLIDSSLHNFSYDFVKLEYSTQKTPDEILFYFEGNASPEVYAVTIDGEYGLAVDNIPLRGSSGLVFSKSDTVLLKKIYKDLNVGLLVLQFGGNIVPHQANNYNFYRRYFSRELQVIKRILPGIPVIVVGPSDMSIKDKGDYITYPSLEKVRDALRLAALENDFAFWDMYEAMGGYNSMPSWVWAEPPLAINDFVHFNARGAGIIGEMFYNAILYEYNNWLKTEEQERFVAQSHKLSRNDFY